MYISPKEVIQMCIQISFKQATVQNLEEIVTMYRKSFKKLYEKYHDDTTSPYKEPKEVIENKLSLKNSYYFFIQQKKKNVGIIRILLDNKENTAKISPILILPEFQNQGLAQKSLIQIEKKFPDIKTWVLDTIKQEKKLVHLYLKAGYQIIDGKDSRIQDGMNIIYFYKKV